jgi:hypothetical protein
MILCLSFFFFFLVLLLLLKETYAPMIHTANMYWRFHDAIMLPCGHQK